MIFLLIGVVGARVLVFYVRRKYPNKKIRSGWLGAISFGLVTGFSIAYCVDPLAFGSHPSPRWTGDPWVLSFIFSGIGIWATRILDHPLSRVLPLALAWYFILLAFYLFLAALWVAHFFGFSL